MTCKNCIHYDVCVNDDNRDVAHRTGAEHCRSFKDVEMFVEIPCKVGATAYRAIFYKNHTFSHCVPAKVVGFHIGDFPDVRGHKQKSYLIVQNPYINKTFHIPMDTIGVTTFFNKAELESTLGVEYR